MGTETKWTKLISVRLEWEVLEFISDEVRNSYNRRATVSSEINKIIREKMEEKQKK